MAGNILRSLRDLLPARTAAFIVSITGMTFAQTVSDIPPWAHRAPDRPPHTIWIEGESFDLNDNGIIKTDTNAYGGLSWAPNAAHTGVHADASHARYSFSISAGGQYLISIAERAAGTNARVPSSPEYSLDLTPRVSASAASDTIQGTWKHLMLADLTRGPHTLHVYAAAGSLDALDAIAILREPFTVIPMPVRVRACAPMGLFTNAPVFAPRGYAPPRPLIYRILDRRSNEIACGGWLFASELRIPDVPLGAYTALFTEGSNTLSLAFARIDTFSNAYLLSLSSADAAIPADVIDLATYLRAAIRIRFDATNTAIDIADRAHPFIAKKLSTRITQSVPIFIRTNGQYDIASYFRFAGERAGTLRGIDTWEFIYDAPVHHWNRRAIEQALSLGGRRNILTTPSIDNTTPGTGAIMTDGGREVHLMPKAPASVPAVNDIFLTAYPRHDANAYRVNMLRTNIILDIAVWNCSSAAKVITLSNIGAHPGAFTARVPSMSLTNLTLSAITNVHANIVIFGRTERMLAPLIIPVRELSGSYRR